ncbi:MAG: hypothetical protein ACJ8CR_05545 [Roseiflexaceae bacterium]
MGRSPRIQHSLHRHLHSGALLLLALALMLGYWWAPIQGQVLILFGSTQSAFGAWPQIWTDPPAARPNDDLTIYVRDTVPWSHVKLLIDELEAPRDEAYAAGGGPWTWRWHVRAPNAASATLVFYHSCHTGCTERGRVAFGAARPDLLAQALRPTKLGVVFAAPERDWHGRSGWTVELTYALRQTDDIDFSIDGLARRARQASRSGLRVLVRVAYDRQQALPPAGDEVALEGFLAYCARLARDDRLNYVYGYIIGAGFNTSGENTLAPTRPTTPAWYARVFNGYGLPPTRVDNVVQTMRAIDPLVRVLVGPVAPWNSDQNGEIADPQNQPWLNYMNTLAAWIDAATRARQEQGIPLAGPDGFALRAPGRVDAPAVAARPDSEPTADLHRPAWGAAQAGFRVYRDWLAIINRYPTTRGLPACISSTNTVTSAAPTPPAQNYPAGWLTAALAEIDREPQVQALCWFVDESLGEIWNDFSLEKHPGRLHDTAEEFDRLLQQ